MDLKPREYKYETKLVWTSEHKGDISSPGKITIPVACPPEWGGHPGIWTPEDLFVGSIELCTMTTFLWMLDAHKLKIKSYKSQAVGTAKMVHSSFVFSEITVEPVVEVFREEDIETTRKLFEECGKKCLITKSVASDVFIKPSISVAAGGVD